VIRLEGITKTYPMGNRELTVLHGITFNIERGEMVAIMGASGSGKSTTLNILGCLDHPGLSRSADKRTVLPGRSRCEQTEPA